MVGNRSTRFSSVVGRCLLVVFATAVLAGCSQREADVAEDDAVRVRFAYQDRVADSASMVAVAKGFFEEEGIEIQPIVFSSGPACSETLLSGSADIGTMGDTTAVIAIARSPVNIIASHGGGEHRHRLMVAEKSAIHAPEDLAGKRLAVKKGTSTYGGLLAWADSVDLDLSDVNIVEMRPGDMGDALLAGSVDAIVASEPTPSVVEQLGGRELTTLGGLGNNYPILLVARAEFLEEHPEAVTAFLRAMKRGAAFINEHPTEALQIVAEKTGMRREVAARAMDHHYYSVQLDEETQSSLDAIGVFLTSQNMLDSPPHISEGIDESFLRAVSQPSAP